MLDGLINFISSGYTIVLALLGLSFLIFIHELGHYFAARWRGMRVQTFSIGFGKPMYQWKRGDVDWQIGWLPFGGFVKMGGMDTENGVAAEDIPDGFFGRSPLDRLIVAIAGPLVNLVFAFLLFAAIWGFGGISKSYSQYTHTVGWVDPQSDLFAMGVRPGDEIMSYDGHPFRSSKDHLYAPMLGGDKVHVEGFKVDAASGERTPFEGEVSPYPNPHGLLPGLKTLGIEGSASYLVYDRHPDGSENPLPPGSPLAEAGLEYGDRLFWVDGEVVYSLEHLSYILNSGRALLTVERAGERLLVRVPRVAVGDIKIDTEHSEELNDWQYESKLTDTKFGELFYIPYNLDDSCTVEDALTMIDPDRQAEVFPDRIVLDSHQQLLAGDRILAVDGTPVTESHQLLKQLQDNRVHVVIERGVSPEPQVIENGDVLPFDTDSAEALRAITQAIGSGTPVEQSGNLVLLNPLRPVRQIDFYTTAEDRALYQTRVLEQRRKMEMIPDPKKRAAALAALDRIVEQKLLGVAGVQDRRVWYNPGPVQLFSDVVREIWRTLGSLVTGTLNPKFMSGPIGIVQVMQTSWSMGIGDAMFWLAAISLNLGFLNLMPVPVLDGGYIVMSLWEMVSGTRLNPKVVERMIIPFAVLLIGLFVFLTFNDLSRVFGRFLG